MGLKSKREVNDGAKAPRGGSAARHEGGFAEGTHGRGPTPYSKSHSKAPGTFEQHKATAGRGAAGIYGKSDAFKQHAQDLEHPDTHAEFEQLGRG